jgi:glycerate dehydrogenase
MDELFKRSDVVSLHCPLTADNEGFVNATLLNRMKPSSFLINTSRGPLVNETDLAAALDAGTLAGAGLDVVSAEPIKADNPMLKAKNCLITPHIAWATLEARQRLMQTTVENVSGFIDGSPINVVN